MPHTQSKSFAKQARTYLLPSIVLAATGLMGTQSALAVTVKAEPFIEAKDPGHGSDERRHFLLH